MAIDSTVVVDSDVQNTISWVNNSTFDGGFHVERSDDSGSTWDRVGVFGSGTLTTADSGVDNITNQFLYRVSPLPRGTGEAGEQAMEGIFPGAGDATLPSGVPGVHFWAEADNNGWTAGACNYINYWDDKSGGGVLYQGVNSEAPLLGSGNVNLPAGSGGECGGSGVGGSGANGHFFAIFDGVSEEMTAPTLGLSSGTLFFVLRPGSLESGVEQHIIAQASGGTSLAGTLAISPSGGSPGLSIWDGSAWNTSIPSANLTVNDFQIVTVHVDEADNATGYVGQTAYNTVSAALEFNADDWTVGGLFQGTEGNFFDGEIAEMLFYNSPLSDEHTIMIQQFLELKYNL
jgi:hypothetical protein